MWFPAACFVVVVVVLFSSDGTMSLKVLERVVVNLSSRVFCLIDSLTMTATAYEEISKFAEIY